MTADDTGSGTAPTMPTARREPDGAGSDGAADFLAGVRAALADLPEAELGEILDDVRSHLAELREESGIGDRDAIVARLGPPQEYAAELRAAAGYPPAPPASPRRNRVGKFAARLAVIVLLLSTLVASVAGMEPPLLLFAPFVLLPALPMLLREGPGIESVRALPVVRAVLGNRPAAGSIGSKIVDFVASLQPGWWVARALVAAALIGALVGSADSGSALGPLLLLAIAGLPVSIWLGHRSRRDRRWLWLVVPLNAFAAVLALTALLAGPAPSGEPQPASTDPSGLWQNGEPVDDLRPYDAQGRPLSGVYLFDQDGRPVDTLNNAECDPGKDATGGPSAGPRPYPRGTTQYDDLGRCVVVPPAPLVVAVPTVAPTGTPAAPPAGSATTVPLTSAPTPTPTS